MISIFEKIKRSTRFYYYSHKNDWSFPSNIAHVSGGKMAQGSYEPEVSSIITEKLHSSYIFIDVGANIGYFSRLASDVVGESGNIYAFEVEMENYHALLQNTKNHPNVQGMHLAVSNENTFIEFNHSSHSACHSIVDSDNLLDGKTYSVPTITLDHFWEIYLDKQPIQLAKIDVEGAELLVLGGMERLFREKMINTIIIEFCPQVILNAGFEISEMYKKLAPHFSISVIDEKYKAVLKDGIIQSEADLQKLSNHLLEDGDAVNINLLCNSKHSS